MSLQRRAWIEGLEPRQLFTGLVGVPFAPATHASVTTIFLQPNPTRYGTLVTIAAQASPANPSDGIVPTGPLSFFELDANGEWVPQGSSTVDGGGTLAEGESTFAPGAHTLKASYAGDSNFTGSDSQPIVLQIDKAPTHTSLTASTNELDATVTAAALELAYATGDITFRDGTQVLGVVPVDSNNHASLSVSLSPNATHDLTATYGGDVRYLASQSPTLSHPGPLLVPAITISVATDVASVGQPMSISAQVVAADLTSPVPTGDVQFLATGDNGAVELGTVPLDSDGLASLAFTPELKGTYYLSAVYSGDSSFTAGASARTTEEIGKADTQTTVSLDLDSSLSGTISAIVTPIADSSQVPTGAITFADGATVLGVAPLDASGSASLAVSLDTFLGHSITASYSGEQNYLPSGSDPSVVEAAQTAGVADHPYEAILNRAPTTSESASIQAALQRSDGVEQVQRKLLGSAAYYLASGDTDAAFATAATQFVTGRSPTTRVIALWRQRQHTQSQRSRFVAALLKSAPARTKFVESSYQRYLQRTPGAAELIEGRQFLSHHSRLTYLRKLLPPSEFTTLFAA